MTWQTWTVLHPMHYEYDGEAEYWVCDECGKKVRIKPYTVLKRGDPAATHHGSHGGLTIGRVEIKTERAE